MPLAAEVCEHEGDADEDGPPATLYATITQELAGLSSKVQTAVASGLAAAKQMTTRVCSLLQDWLETVKVGALLPCTVVVLCAHASLSCRHGQDDAGLRGRDAGKGAFKLGVRWLDTCVASRVRKGLRGRCQG